MAADIFISYSSEDRHTAEHLAETLTSSGFSVWIDRQGIHGAANWSKEIVEGINNCQVFLLLISSSSIASHNVVKEISLASEKRKKLLPVDLEPVTLTSEFEYQLAGIQRTPIANTEGIIHALFKLGLHGAPITTPTAPSARKSDSRKSLMILPFEDLSPMGDNAWFADGIVSELIGTLSNLKSLRLMDQQETKGFKTFKGHLVEYARIMDVRYFVQGSVRKFGDQIKIMTQLLDIETGEHLWQDSHKGTMEDIFEIQEAVAQKVVDGLTLHLTSDEKTKLSEHGTANVEAYELYLKAQEYFGRQTKEGFRIAVKLITESIELDPTYILAYQYKAHALASLFRNYDRDPALLAEAESLCLKALRLRPNLTSIYEPLSLIYMLQGKSERSEETALEFIRKAPEDPNSHFALAFFYGNTGQTAKAIVPLEETVRLRPENRSALFNLAVSCYDAKETIKCMSWAHAALPVEERHLKLQPDDENSRMHYAALLFYSGRTEEAYTEAKALTNARDGFSLYNTSCLLAMLNKKEEALATFGEAIALGFKAIPALKEFLTTDRDGVVSLAGTPEYEAAVQLVAQIEAGTNV